MLTFVVPCSTGQVIFHAGHMLIFPAVYISFTGLLKNIVWAHENLCRACIFLELHVRWACKLKVYFNVNPCIGNADDIVEFRHLKFTYYEIKAAFSWGK